MLEQSVRYLGASDDRVRTIAIGGLLTLLSPFLIPLFGVLGYVVRVVERTAAGNEEPPAFDDWEDLLVDGAKAFVITFVYALVPAAVGGTVAVLGLGLGEIGQSGALSVLGVLVGGLVWLVAALAAGYVVPAALANYADRRTIGSGFAFGALRPVLASGTYFTGWLYALAVVLAGGIVAGALNGIPVLGTFVGAFVGFYALVSAYYIVGRTWGEVRPVTVHEGETPEDRTAV